MFKKLTPALVSALITFCLYGATDTAYAKNNSKPSNSKVNILTDQEAAVRDVLIALQKLFTLKDANAMASLFMEDALFIDQTANETRGRAELIARFDRMVKGGTATIGIHPESVTFPSDNVALVVGEVSRGQDSKDVPCTRFSMVLVKTKSSWLIDEVTETAMQAAPLQSQLQQLEWLVGKWSASSGENSVQLNVEWTPSKRFITSKCMLKKGENTPQIDDQIIGWDPQHNRIISWHFDNNGGFGNGVWLKEPNENEWVAEITGVGADGGDTMESNSFTQKSPDEFVWQSTHRSVDGIAIADTAPTTVHRVKP